MSRPHLPIVHFEGQPLHTLSIRGRPAWSAREIGTLLGYSHEGKHFAGKIASEWANEFVPERDFTLLAGEELADAKRQCLEVSASTRGLLVLFESGLHLALVKTQMPVGVRLRRFLVDEVLPKLVRNESIDGEDDESLLEHIVSIRGLKADTEDRKFRYRALLQAAGELLQLGRIDEDTWSQCIVRACEIALGQPLALLRGTPGRDWVTIAALAEQLGVDGERIVSAARAMGLLERSRYARPLASREDDGWRLTFRLSPEAVERIVAWLAEPTEPELV